MENNISFRNKLEITLFEKGISQRFFLINYSFQVFESRRFAARWERSPILGPLSGISHLPSLSPIGAPLQSRTPQPQLQPRLSPNRPPSRRSFGGPSGGGSDSFLHTSPVRKLRI